MDTLTHALSGALLGRATAPRRQTGDTLSIGRRTFVGALAAAFPDIDVVASYLSPLSYLYHHRGVTHSLLMLPLWALLLALIFGWLSRGRPGWRAYYGICAMAIGIHIAGDWITSFGTMIFAPFSDARYALGATFIIDLWFTGIIVAGLIASWIWRRSRVPAIADIVLLAGYVAFQTVLQHRAIDFGEQYARANGINSATVTAIPRPVSPFNWMVIVADAERYRYANVNLIRKTAHPEPGPETGFIATLDAAYRPLHDARWMGASLYGDPPRPLAREAFSQPDFRFFRWFAAYPALLKIDAGNPHSCVWFHDLRFVTPGRPSLPFLYGMCKDDGGAWKPYQLVGRERKAVY